MPVKFTARIKVHALRRLAEAFRRGVSFGLMDIGDAILAESQKNVPTGATTGLKESGRRIPPKPNEWVEVDYSAPYAIYVHEGTRPHFPPPDALVRWVELVLNVRGKEAQAAAWAIARAIAKRGTKPNRFLTDAVDVVWPHADAILKAAIKREIDRVTLTEHPVPKTAEGRNDVARSLGAREEK